MIEKYTLWLLCFINDLFCFIKNIITQRSMCGSLILR